MFLVSAGDKSGSLAWVEERIAAATLFSTSLGEPFNLLRYELGQHYDSHSDAFDEKASEGLDWARRGQVWGCAAWASPGAKVHPRPAARHVQEYGPQTSQRIATVRAPPQCGERGACMYCCVGRTLTAGRVRGERTGAGVPV